MSLGTRNKDPQEARLFTFDWTAHLGSDTIATSVIDVPSGIVKDAEAIATGDQKTTVKLSGGTVAGQYVITNTITTSAGETLQRSGVVAVRQL